MIRLEDKKIEWVEMDTHGVPILYNGRFGLAAFREVRKIDPAGFLSENGDETIWGPGKSPEIPIPELRNPIDELEP